MKRLILLGSTGSIGTNTLNVVRRNPDSYQIVGLAAHRRAAELLNQAQEFSPAAVAVSDTAAAGSIDAAACPGDLLVGPDAPERLVRDVEADMVVAAMSGAAGLPPVLAALETGKDVALANKETLVMAGCVVMRLAERRGRRIVPVDSEHSAVFQAIQSGKPAEVETVILTASGGALRDIPPEQWHEVTPEQALRHPNWNMGPKITIDSASLMNKALEIIEAHWLFSMPPEKIEVLIHPESIIHSLVQFHDGSVLAQLGLPDMRLPIQYALTYPDRLPSAFPRLKLGELGTLTFREPRHYRTLDLAYEVLKIGGLAGAVFNAANEIAVPAFLEGRIKFTAITDIVGEALARHTTNADPSLEEIVAGDRWARDFAQDLVGIGA